VRYPSGEAGGFDGREVTYGWGELDNLVPAYACTIHKSQGSDYPAVVIPLLTQHYAMLQRNLVYTGITRGKQLVVLVGQKKALAMAVKNHMVRGRYTKLAEWLKLTSSRSQLPSGSSSQASTMAFAARADTQKKLVHVF
jgi:exodeoxyribonuclease V alpha subunit